MDVVEFVECSIGRWRSQRSGHSLALSHFEEVRSTIDIVSLPKTAPEIIELCKYSGVCLLYTSPSPRDGLLSRMPSSA